MARTINIGGRLHSTEVGNVLTGANEILDDVKGKKQNVINSEVSEELTRLDQSKQNNLTFDNTPTENSTNPVTSGGVYAADKALSDAIEAVLVLIPSAASALNQLADKEFVNSTEATNTATFRGTSATGLTEQQFLDWADSLTHDKNDYVFWQTIDAAGNTLFKRYKYDGTQWLYEYTLNNSSFTADQWAAIMSGITAALVEKLSDLPTAAQLVTSFDGKQNVLTFDNAPTQGSDNPVKSGGVYTAIKNVADDVNTINGKIPAEATALNQLADKAYVVAEILAATPAFKGQFTTLADLQAVANPKAGDLGIVRTKDSDGYDVFTFYQYLNDQWNVFYTLSRHPQTKPATTGATGVYPFNGMGRVELPMNIVEGVNTLTQSMMPTATGGNTIYVIQYDFVLGENITVPDNCVLEFDGGSISGAYTINGDFKIISSSIKIFNDVTLNGYTGDFKFSWVVGNKTALNSSDFQKLPNTLIDFEFKNYTVNEYIYLDAVKDATFKNLNLTINGHINHRLISPSELYTGTCTYVDDGSSTIQTKITTSISLPQNYVGKMISIKTADKVRYDWRPDEDGMPSLWKGLTTIILKIEGNVVTLADYIEKFSDSKTYNGTTVTPSFTIYEPYRLNFENCNFILNSRSSIIDNSGYNYYIKNCTFKAPNGSDRILGMSGYLGVVENCVIDGAGYEQSGYSYGIQVGDGTNYIIKDSSFINNKRGVDFSGFIESRYNEVINCYFTTKFLNSDLYGSALGGHSTSYGNKFTGNTLMGYYSVGIECRGEKEIIDGNIFRCQTGTDILNGIDTIIKNNVKEFNYPFNSDFVTNYIELESGDKNSITIVNNKISVRQKILYNTFAFNGNINICDNIITAEQNTVLKPCIMHQYFDVDKIKVMGNLFTDSRGNYITFDLFDITPVRLNLSYCIINGVMIPVKLKGGFDDLSPENLAKVTINYGWMHLDTTTQFYKGSFGGSIKVVLDFTLSESLTQNAVIGGDEYIGWNIGETGGYVYTRKIPLKYTNNDNIYVSASNNFIFIGLNTYNGLLTAGNYHIEFEL